MDDEAGPILQAVTALRAAGVTVALVGDELERWQIGDLAFFDADLWGLAAIRGLVENVDPR